ncbi:ribosomal maturation YjgA family protein [Arthrobacter sp. 35W]|uniref:ribosomal maturation YjgA family protein n=1 Tax=Arthrobacter sp. 35W TaxID=1132441 RepID=UPI000555518B|nr:DUF2809 domain-containing protein [Arthrobacter sp. 35W]
MRRTSRRRVALAAAAVAVLGTGLAVHYFGSGPFADFAGDALYTVLVFVLLGLLFPRLSSAVVGVLALAVSVGIELLQLTGIPAELTAAFPPFRLLLGTTFAATDLPAYAVGALAALLVDAALRRGAARRSWRTARSR